MATTTSVARIALAQLQTLSMIEVLSRMNERVVGKDQEHPVNIRGMVTAAMARALLRAVAGALVARLAASRSCKILTCADLLLGVRKGDLVPHVVRLVGARHVVAEDEVVRTLVAHEEGPFLRELGQPVWRPSGGRSR